MRKKIEQVLEDYVRPQLLKHEGGVEIKEWKDGVLKVKLLGQCSGCPSASITTEELIAAEVKERIPEVKEVVLVHEISQDLIDLAKKLMGNTAEKRGKL